ncbi:MAG: ketopantoate reductase [Deltaproteobacteria bacterium]|nr:ketopantoate reductase [Deltaproteobacteria bacterium]
MRVLLVGAGAVGQVYGETLARGGAEVGFLVKPAHAGEAQDGYALHALRTWRRPRSSVFVPDAVFTQLGEAAQERWDQLWLCVSSTALRKPGFEDILARIDADLLVALQPGLEDRHWLLERWPADRLVRGVIPLIAYQSPLPGRDDQPAGIAWWLPPFAKVPFDGPEAAVARVVAPLCAGGWPARHVTHAPEGAASISAILMPHLVALESAGWSFDALRRGDGLDAASAASREALAIVAHGLGLPTPAFARRLSPGRIRALMAVAPKLMPLPLEPYLAWHFTKVGDQTRQHMEHYIERGQAAGLSTAALESLYARLDRPSKKRERATSPGT